MKKISVLPGLKAHIVDAFSGEIYGGEIEVGEGIITGISKCDVPDDAPYVMPGFVDGHIHIESTLLVPEQFAPLALSHGTVAVVADPHEIANVAGVEGIEYMVESAAKSKLHFAFAVPSCVPATNLETSGATLDSEDVAGLISRKEFCALAEMMNAPGVFFRDKEVTAKIDATLSAGKPVDGHLPLFNDKELSDYIGAGISTNHELMTLEDGRRWIDAGGKLQIREGSAARNYRALSPLLARNELRGKLFLCTDDKTAADMVEGHIDSIVRMAIDDGYSIFNIIWAASIAPVLHYNLPVGLLRKGDRADFIVVDNLKDLNVLQTWICGENVFSAGSVLPQVAVNGPFPNKFFAEPLTTDDIRVRAEGGNIKVISVKDGELYTGCEVVSPLVVDGCAVSDTQNDVLKILVYNRYKPAKPAVAFVRGFGLKDGAFASSIAHDSHNIVALGTCDEDIVAVVNRLIEEKGGVCAGKAGDVECFPLPVGGLMSPLDGRSVARKYQALKDRAVAMGCPFADPFMTMSFMALPVIPELKITDKGLFDGLAFQFTPLWT